jgi:UPF0176 protein
VLQPQFARGEVIKRYLARVIGDPPQDFFECEAAITPPTEHSGDRAESEPVGLKAHTECRVLTRFPDGTALLCVTPLTARPNQIRVHLWHLGWPVVGDQVFRPHHQVGDEQTLGIEDGLLKLHAWQLAFSHPDHGGLITFETARPPWA